MKRRIILIVILIGIVGGLFLAVYWYAGRNRSVKLLARAELALRAQNFDRALDLAGSYIAKYPDDWRGYYLQARANIRLGRYEEARSALQKLLAQREELQTDAAATLILLAETYALPAKRTLTAGDTPLETGALKTVIQQLQQANKVLLQVETEDEKLILDVQEAMGLDEADIGNVLLVTADRFKKEAEIAGTAGAENIQKDKLAQSDAARAEAQTVLNQAIRTLLDVVTRDAERKNAAQSLVQLCIEQGDHESLEAASAAIQAAEKTSPIAKMLLIMNELQTSYEQPVFDRPAEVAKKAKVVQAAQKLDELLKQYPKEEQVKIRRAELALMLSDADTAERLVGEILKENSRQGQARLIEAKVLLLRGKTAEAEQKLFVLKAEFFRWPEAHYIYGQAALALGKGELARQAMRRVTELDPGHAGARRYLAQSLLSEGYYDQAFMDAQAYYQAHPDDPAAIALFVKSAVPTDHPDLARQALEKTISDYVSKPILMMAVSDGYAFLKDHDKMLEAARLAAEGEAATTEERRAVAQALARLDRIAEAEKLLSDELTREPQSAEVHFELGRIYFKTGRTLQALERFQDAVRFDANNNEYRLATARVLLDIGELSECQQVLDQLDAFEPRANFLRLQVSLIQGRPVDTEEALQQVDSTAGLGLALACLREGQPQRCVTICQEELEKNSGDTDVRVLMGQAYLALGQPQECLEQFKTVLQMAPGQFSHYLRLAYLLSRDADPEEAAGRIKEIPGAIPDMIDLTKGWLYERSGKQELALAEYNRLAGGTEVLKNIRNLARWLMARILAQRGEFDRAIDELDKAAEGRILSKRMGLLKVRLLIAAKKTEPARLLLGELKVIAWEQRDVSSLNQIAGLYLGLNQTDEALGICAELEQVFPHDPQTYLLRASVAKAAGRLPESIDSYRKAIACQPGNFSIYRSLAKTWDDQQEPNQALEVLEELEGLGETGRSAAWYEQGAMFARWGLQSQAVKCFEELAGSGHGDNPKIKMALGQAFARLGKKEQARKVLEDIPRYAEDYVSAQLMLVDLTEKTGDKLNILEQLGKSHPGRVSVLVRTMNILLDEGRASEAVTIFRDFAKNRALNKTLPSEFQLPFLPALSRTEDQASVAALTLEAAQQTKQQMWVQLAVLMAVDAQTEVAADLLPEVNQSGLYEALLGFYLNGRAENTEKAKLWGERVNQINRQLQKLEPPQIVPATYRTLINLALGATDQAEAELERFTFSSAVDKTIASELISYVKAQQGRGEALQLLKTSIALDLGLTTMARSWAQELLKARPQGQWAAALVLAAGADEPELRLIWETLEPKDNMLAQAVHAELLMRNKQYEESAAIYSRLAAMQQDRTDFLLKQAMAWENAGHLAQALELYRQVWRASANPVAANNAAYVSSQLAPAEADKLNEALEWAETAVKAAPAIPAFHDTKGWVIYLQGHAQQACKELQQAIKGLPDSPEVHYHLGMAEMAAGHINLARWHLLEAVEIGHRYQADGAELPPTMITAIALAQEALDQTNQ